MRRSNAGSKFAARLVAKITIPLNASNSRSRTLMVKLVSRSYGIGLVKKEDCILLRRCAKCSDYVFRGFAEPHRFCLGIVDNQKLLAESMSDRLGADRLSSPGWSGKVKR